MTTLIALVTLLLVALTAPAGATHQPRPAPDPGGGLAVWTTHALEKVRPDALPPARSPGAPAPGVAISAARNEFEPFQLVLRSGERPVHGVDVTLSDLYAEAGDGTIESRHGSVYLERFLRLETPSVAGAEVGEWPDPLVPRVDAYAGERRNAFPFDLAPERSQPVWVEVYVPTDAAPGIYRGELRVEVAGERRAEVPVRLRVWPFTLPSTSSLPTSFGFSGVSALEQHRGRYTSDEDLFALTRVYAEAALRHRISIHGGSMAPPESRFGREGVEIDWPRYDREVAPLLDGTLLGPGDPLPGARATSIDLRTAPGLTDERKVLLWRAWARHFRERGWLGRLFVYLMDEPEGPEDYRKVLRLARLARQADPELRTLLTEQRTPALAGAVDVWVTLVNCLVDRPGHEVPCEAMVPRSAYRAARRGPADDEEGGGSGAPWWYQSCASHGCDRVGSRDLAGWPSYVIDAPAAANRIFPWLAWTHAIGGELYYNTVEAYGAGADPWRDVYRHGGNGDGTLFYPGTPSRIGGATDVPVESVRLKLIREGLEDYEYLVLAARTGVGAGGVRELAGTLAPRLWEQDRSPGALYAARERLARAIVAAGKGGAS